MIVIDVLRVERRQAAGYGTCSNSARAVAGETHQWYPVPYVI